MTISQAGDRDLVTVGVVTPHAVAGADVELEELAGDLVTTRVVRVRAVGGGVDSAPPSSAGGLRALTRPAVLDDAVARLEPETLDVLAHSSTSSAYAIGHAAELDVVTGLRERWSVPVCSTVACAVEALRSLDVLRLSLVHPPWFGADRSALGAAYFREQGFAVVQAELADVADDPELIRSGHVVDWVATHVDPSVDAVFLGGNGFRAARAVPELEDRLGSMVLTSNQVLLWSALVLTGTAPGRHGLGTLLDTCRPSASTDAADRRTTPPRGRSCPESF